LPGYSGVSATSVCQWRMARVFNVRLVDLLTGSVSPSDLQSLDCAGVPHWRNLWVRRPMPFNKIKVARQMDEVLRELPPPSMRTFERRNGYHYATLRKHFPAECRAVQERFREYCAASIQERQAKKIAEFRQIAYQTARTRDGPICEPRTHADVRTKKSGLPHRTRAPGRD